MRADGSLAQLLLVYHDGIGVKCFGAYFETLFSRCSCAVSRMLLSGIRVMVTCLTVRAAVVSCP